MTKQLTIDDVTAKLSAVVIIGSNGVIHTRVRFGSQIIGTVRFDWTESGWQEDTDTGADAAQPLLDREDCADIEATDLIDAVSAAAQDAADGVTA